MARLAVTILLLAVAAVNCRHEENEGWMRSEGMGKSLNLTSYYTHEEINDFLDELARSHPNKVTVINGALSYEFRQIKYVRISTSNFENNLKPIVVVEAGARGRDWVTTAAALYAINQLVDGEEDDVAQNVDWIIIPVVNPDGYEFSFTEDRSWTKTRSRSHANSDVCPGVDLDRNFPIEWGTNAAFSSPCIATFEGPSAFSEVESRLIQSAVMGYLSRVRVYISLQSFGSTILYGWGTNGTLPNNGLAQHLLGTTIAQAINSQVRDDGKQFVVGNAAAIQNTYSTGTSRDWALSLGIPYSFTFQLSDYGNGYTVLPEDIRQVAEETWSGIHAAGSYLYNN